MLLESQKISASSAMRHQMITRPDCVNKLGIVKISLRTTYECVHVHDKRHSLSS